MTKLIGLVATVAVVLVGCAGVPDSVQGPADPAITLATVRGNDAVINGQLVRWGGLVAKVQNKDNQSWIEIVEQPLNSSGRPSGNNVTGGRFIAVFGGLLDPLIFQTGREITVVGSLQPGVEGKINDQPYKFPMLSGSGYHLWEPRAERYHDDLILQGGYWSPFWYRPYYPVIIHHHHAIPPRAVGTGNSSSTGHGGAAQTERREPAVAGTKPAVSTPSAPRSQPVRESATSRREGEKEKEK